MTATTQQDPCGDSFNIDDVVIKHGAHGPSFRGECCIIEWSNRAAAACRRSASATAMRATSATTIRRSRA
jgi:hypothetical protein